MFVDYYALLHLRPSCSAKEVRESFKKLALLYHPDRSEDSGGAGFREIKDAYDVLSDPARRYLYDLGYAEMLQVRQRQEEAEERRRREWERIEGILQRRQAAAARLQPSRKDASPTLSFMSHSDNYLINNNNNNNNNYGRRVSSAGSTSGTLQTPMSASLRTLAPAFERPSTRNGEAAQAIPRQGSALMAVRASRAAELQRSNNNNNNSIHNSAAAMSLNASRYTRQTFMESLPSEQGSMTSPTGLNFQSYINNDVKDEDQRRLQEELTGDEEGEEQNNNNNNTSNKQQQQQQQQRQSNYNKRFGSTSILIPKKTTLQWGVEQLRPPTLSSVPPPPPHVYFRASVAKTWRVFFHLPEERRNKGVIEFTKDASMPNDEHILLNECLSNALALHIFISRSMLQDENIENKQTPRCVLLNTEVQLYLQKLLQKYTSSTVLRRRLKSAKCLYYLQCLTDEKTREEFIQVASQPTFPRFFQ